MSIGSGPGTNPSRGSEDTCVTLDTLVGGSIGKETVSFIGNIRTHFGCGQVLQVLTLGAFVFVVSRVFHTPVDTLNSTSQEIITNISVIVAYITRISVIQVSLAPSDGSNRASLILQKVGCFALRTEMTSSIQICGCDLG
jgi:hypothetical protein